MRRRWVLVAVVVLAVVASAGLVATAQSDAENETEYTLSELRQDGTSYANSPDSVRLSDSEMYWLIHWPAGISGTPGDPEDDYWRYLSPDDVVDRNSVWLRSINTDSAKDLTVTVVKYDVGEREVHNKETNTTTTERYAKNVSTKDHNVTINRGWAMEEIPLGQSDGRDQVTVWVEDGSGAPSEELRWTFEHESVATTQGLPFSSWGGLLRWSMIIFMIPLGVGGVVELAGSKRLIDRTGKGIGWGYGAWTALFAVLGAIIVASFWGNIAGLVVDYPWLMVLYVLSYLGVLMLETFEQHTKRVRFERDELQETTMPSDEVGVDVLGSDERTLTVIDKPDEPSKVASDGLLAFLARAVTGDAARLRTVDPGHEDADMHGETDTWKDPLRCQSEVRQGNVDMRAFVHPLSPQVVDYEPEGWNFSMPDLSDTDDYVQLASKLALTLTAAAISWYLSIGLVSLAVVIAGAAWIGLRPREGYARVWAAPVHYRSARATAFHLAEETDNGETIEKEREMRLQTEISREKDILNAVDDRDSTLIHGQFAPEGEKPSSVDDFESPDLEERRTNGHGGDDE